MSDSITLHPDKGVNPRLTTCPRCGEDGPELVLVGIKDFVDICDGCGFKYYGGKPAPKQPYEGTKCLKCGGTSYKRRKLGEYEKIPSTTLCAKCEEEVSKARKIVEDGGIYYRCSDCGTEAVIPAGHELSKEVRAKLNIEPPLPCGVEFTKKECPLCRSEH